MEADTENDFMAPISMSATSKSPLEELPSIRRVSFRDVEESGGTGKARRVPVGPYTATPFSSPNASPLSESPVLKSMGSPAAAAATATAATTTAICPNEPNASSSAPAIFRKKTCCIRHNINRIDELINIIIVLPSLSSIEKTTIRTRYIELLLSFNRRCRVYGFLFRLLRIIVTVGSLLVPALLSVQYDEKYKTNMYWATWIISLAVTTSNGIFTLFKIDKKYYFINTIRELLVSEGWQYIALTGRYGTGGHLPVEGGVRTHAALFPYFCHYVEKIKLKQVEEEYYKGIESNQTQASAAAVPASTTQPLQSGATAIQASNKLYQITPDKSIAQSEKNVEGSTKVQVNQFLNNMALAQQQAQQQQAQPK